MKRFPALLAIVSVTVCASAQTLRKPTKDGYLRCMATAQILARDFAKGENKKKYETELEAWVKLNAWFFPDSKSFIAESAKITRSMQLDLAEKRLTPEAFVAFSDQCSVLLVRTLSEFMQCVEENGSSEEQRRQCAKGSIGR